MTRLSNTVMPTAIQPPRDRLTDPLRDYMVHGRNIPTLDELFKLAPIDPSILNDCDDWAPKTRTLVARFPGADPDYYRREDAKYKAPPSGSPLTAWVASLIYTARAHWSRDVHTADGWPSQTRLQFREWLPRYLEHTTWFWHWGGYAEAAQLLRLACGLSRFPQRLMKEG